MSTDLVIAPVCALDLILVLAEVILREVTFSHCWFLWQRGQTAKQQFVLHVLESVQKRAL